MLRRHGDPRDTLPDVGVPNPGLTFDLLGLENTRFGVPLELGLDEMVRPFSGEFAGDVDAEVNVDSEDPLNTLALLRFEVLAGPSIEDEVDSTESSEVPELCVFFQDRRLDEPFVCHLCR